MQRETVFCCFFYSSSSLVLRTSLQNIDNEISQIVSDSVGSPKKELAKSPIVYVTSGTTIVSSDDTDFKILNLENPTQKQEAEEKPAKPKKVFADKEKVERKVTKIPQKKYVNPYYFSGSIPSEMYFSKISRAKIAVLNSSTDFAKVGVFEVLLFDFQGFVFDSYSHFFAYNIFISDYHLASFSVRPPPVRI